MKKIGLFIAVIILCVLIFGIVFWLKNKKQCEEPDEIRRLENEIAKSKNMLDQMSVIDQENNYPALDNFLTHWISS